MQAILNRFTTASFNKTWWSGFLKGAVVGVWLVVIIMYAFMKHMGVL